MSQVYHFQNFYVTRLREAIDESSTTIYVDNPPTISSGILVLEGKNASKREIIYFSSVSGYALNDCARGLEGTTPNTHNQGATVEQAVTAGQLDQVLSPHILLQGLGNDENAAMSQDAVTRVITKAHNADGTLKANSVTTAAIANNAVTADKLDFATLRKVLYTGPSATSGSVTLSESIMNFSSIEIATNRGAVFCLTAARGIVLNGVYSATISNTSGSVIAFYSITYRLTSNTTLNIVGGGAVELRASGVSGFSLSNEIVIDSVVGIK